MNEAWMVRCYNELDAGFGYDCGAFLVYGNLTKAAAKSIAKHLNKKVKDLDFVWYYAEPEPDRYW